MILKYNRITVYVIELLRMCISFYAMSVNSVCMI